MDKSGEQRKRKGSKSKKEKSGKKKVSEDNATERPEVSEQPKHDVVGPRLLKSHGSEKEQPSKRQSHHHHHYEAFTKEEFLYTEKFFVRPKTNLAAPATTKTISAENDTVDQSQTDVKPSPNDASGSHPHRKTDHEAVLSKDEAEALQMLSKNVLSEMSETKRNMTASSAHSSNSLDSVDNLNFTSDESVGKWRPDMTWINDSSESSIDFQSQQGSDPETKRGTAEEQITESSKPTQDQVRDSFLEIRRLLSLVAILGRFPFVIFKEQGTSFRCRMKRTARKWDLYILTLFLGIVLILCSVSTMSIFISRIEVVEVDDNDTKTKAKLEQKYTYINLEKLLFQKHWLHITIFLMALLVAFVGNVGVIIYGEDIVDCVNELGKSLYELKYDNASVGLWKLKFLHCFITALDVMALVIFVLTTFGGFKESLQLETILYLRWGLDLAFYHVVDNVEMKFYLYVFIYLVIAIELYAYFVVRNHFVFIITICRSITNSAHGWNSRITHFFGIAVALKNRSMENFGKPLTHETLLKEHLTIIKLVRKISGCFTPILFIFFSTRVLCICCQLFRVSTAFLFDLKVKVEGGNDTIHGSKVKYDPTEKESIYEITYFLMTTLLGLSVVSSAIEEVGRSVMDGFEPVRRYGLLLADSLKGRKFVMSLFMSFNVKVPHIVNPGKWFFIDRGFIVAIVGSALLLFSIMVQFNVVNLVATPIVLPCPDNPTQLCIRTAVNNARRENPNKTIEFNAGVTFRPPSTRPSTSTTTLPTPTTTLPTTTSPTTITTTTTTMRPVCTPIVGPSRFKAKSTMSITEKTKLCVLYCTSTRVHRMIPFDKDANDLINEMIEAWDKDTLPVDCIAKPYEFVVKNKAKYPLVYDCFGNCYDSEDLDKFNHFAFSLNPTTPRKTAVQINNTNFNPTVPCFSDHDVANTDGFNQLEICGIPSPLVESYFKYQKGTGATSNELRTDLIKLKEDGKLYPRNAVSSPPCDKNIEFPTWKTYSFKTFQRNSFIRIIPYSFVYSKELRPIPLDWSGKVCNKTECRDETGFEEEFRQISALYIYMHPRYTSSKNVSGGIDDKRISSFGFYDCFGEKLDQFDDCGGLPFSVWDDTLRSYRRPNITTKVRGSRYDCWESPHPREICGFNDGVTDRQINHFCGHWKNYLSNLTEFELQSSSPTYLVP